MPGAIPQGGAPVRYRQNGKCTDSTLAGIVQFLRKSKDLLMMTLYPSSDSEVTSLKLQTYVLYTVEASIP